MWLQLSCRWEPAKVPPLVQPLVPLSGQQKETQLDWQWDLH